MGKLQFPCLYRRTKLFKRWRQMVWQDYLANDPSLLQQVLQYHISDLEGDLDDQDEIPTFWRKPCCKSQLLTTAIAVNGYTEVVETIVCLNGLVHVIDKVIIPQGLGIPIQDQAQEVKETSLGSSDPTIASSQDDAGTSSRSSSFLSNQLICAIDLTAHRTLCHSYVIQHRPQRHKTLS